MKIENYKLEGTELPIFTYPDPVLSTVAAPVTVFDAELEKLAMDMIYTMYVTPGIGLAAPQVGVSKRLFVIDVEYDREVIKNSEGRDEFRYSNMNPMVVINPVFKEKTGSTTYEEGCLSVPGVYEEVKRSENVVMEFQDIKGNKHTLNAEGLFAICLQHENDHLDGIVFIERLSNLKKNFFKKKLAKEKGR